MKPIDLATLGELYTPSQVTEIIKIQPTTLANWRSQTRAENPTGPRFLNVGGAVRYPEAWINDWLREQNGET